MQQRKTGINGVNVGALGVAREEQRRRLGVYRFQGEEVLAAFPADLDHSWRHWEPACQLLNVPGFPRHVVLAATHRRTALYVIARLGEPGARQALDRLSGKDGVVGFLLVTPTQTEYLTFAHGVGQDLADLLRESQETAPMCVDSLVPPAALLEQLPDLFNQHCLEARRCNKHVAMYLYGDELLFREAVEGVIATPEPAK